VDTIVPISTVTNTAGKPIRVSSPVDALAITPDGETLYAASSTPTGNTVTPISTATNTPGKPIFTSRGHFIFGEHIAIAP
jgi:DNA-binding beta-propeller fold protein YncE